MDFLKQQLHNFFESDLKCGEKVEIANITFLHSNEKFYYFQKEIDQIVEEIKFLLAKR